MSGLALLRKHKVSFNTLTVVNDYNSLQPLEVYRFLKRIGDGHMQFIPAVERLPVHLSSGGRRWDQISTSSKLSATL